MLEDEQGYEVVGDLFGDELNKVRDQLVQSWVGSQARKGGSAILIVRLIEDGTANALKVELKLLGEDVLNEGLDCDIVIAGEGCEGVGTLREEVLGTLICGCRVLGNGWLNALDREPVC